MKKITPGKHTVFFNSDGVKLAALLYVPKEYQPGDKLPGMVITRPASGVKEQTAGLYAQKFSEEGFITLAFDPKGYGESEGRPQVEDPFSVISDTKNAVTFLTSLDAVDEHKIVNTGICMGAGYATAASAEDERIKATAAISPYLTAHIDYPKAYGGKTIVKMMMAIIKPLSATGLNLYFPPVPLSRWSKLMPVLSVQTGMLQYYAPGTPGDVPNWKNKSNLYKAENIMLGTYNPFEYTDAYSKTGKPFFLAYADGGYHPDLLQKFYDDITVNQKDLFVGKNATHFDLYYKPEFVEPIVHKATALFKQAIA